MAALMLMLLSYNSYAQISEVYQILKVEEYQGKRFTLKAKIFYKNKMENESFAVLSAFPIRSQAKVIAQSILQNMLLWAPQISWALL